MKALCYLSFIFFWYSVKAQNYNCLQFGPKNYFINGNNYVRGIRIDSTRTVGIDSVYYPYRTTRIADTMGASWLGKKVVKHSDGTFVFDNLRDTVFIRSHARNGESWAFYNDTSVYTYTATVTHEDTMTVSGMLDSVKTITITSDSAGSSMVWNPWNGFQIILSKNHGFVQVFDLYTFPYFSRGHDYYTDLVLGNLGTCGLCIDQIPTLANSVFRRFQLNIPTTMEIFDFAASDIYESVAIFSRPWPSMSIDETRYVLDNVTARTATAFSVSYSGTENIKSTISAGTTPYTSYTSSVFPVTSAFPTNGDTTLLFPAQLLPEEWNASFLLHYYPKIMVTGTCDSSEVWEVDGDYKNYAHGITYNFVTGYYDAAYIARSYEKGLGLVAMQQFPAGSLFGSDILQQNYVYYRKSGTDCGHFVGVVPNAVPTVNQSNNITVAPNPAGSYMEVVTAGQFDHGTIVSIYDMTGKRILISNPDEQTSTLTINTSTWSEGLYMVIIQNNSGIIKREKIVIAR